jgi:hypothetical protein
MPELVDVLLEDLEEGNEYSVIFPVGVNGEHEAYMAEFQHTDYGEYLFSIVSILSEFASKEENEQFSIRTGEQTTDIRDRTKYMVLEEQHITFPPELDDAHIDTNTDDEINRILDQRNREHETERSRRLRMLIMGSRPSRSPLLRSAQNSPFIGSRSHTPAGGRRRRTRRRTSRRRPSRRRSRPTRPRRTRRRSIRRFSRQRR